MQTQDLKLIANTIRGLSMDAIQQANSGHPGLPMGMADVMAVLWSNFLHYNPSNPAWPNRDRFVLSGGHGSMLLYSALHIYGYDLPLEEIKNFRQWESKTAGHPEYEHTPGVETTTGPLGQGLANAVGMALAEKSLASRYNKKNHEVINHFTYVMAGDGDLEEGISHEAASLAGHLGLGKLILLYDDNQVTIDGHTDLSFSEDVKQRFESYGWHSLQVDGHDTEAVQSALEAAQQETQKPTIIACKTVIGYGSPNKAGTSSVHGSPLGVDEVKLSKQKLGLPETDFYVPDDIHVLQKDYRKIGEQKEETWQKSFNQYQNKYPRKAKTFLSDLAGDFISNRFSFPSFPEGYNKATRAASGEVLNQIAPRISAFIGGSADLTPSNKTFPKGETAFSKENPSGRYIHYGVREHAMGAIMNGLALHGGVLPYGGTFFVFADYMRPAMRMAALMGIQVIYVLTHDSIGLGEDGPTHQPIAHLASLRAMPNMVNIRPMDANETSIAWKIAIKRKTGPTTLVLTRQGLPEYDRTGAEYASAKKAEQGGYILTEDKGYQIIIIASGSEVEIAINTKQYLNEKGQKVRIVSMPSTDIFDQQPERYQSRVLPKSKKKRISIEAGAAFGWHKYIGPKGRAFGLDHFGASAPYKTLYKAYGLDPIAIGDWIINEWGE